MSASVIQRRAREAANLQEGPGLRLDWVQSVRALPMDEYANPKQKLPEDKITLAANPEGTCATIVIAGEDHTLGNALRYVIAKK